MARFIGRHEDLAAIRAALSSSRLVTVTGPGGIGKTRLAEHFAESARDEYPGGLWLCDLSEARDAEGVREAVARGLGVDVGRNDGPNRLAEQLMALGRGLVVLDNFEQIVDVAPETVGAWLLATTDLRFLVTSRERLRIDEEQIFDLEPLAAEDAVALFLDRASCGAGFELTAADRPVVAAIVVKLDRIPLAIELAAARVGVLTPQQLLDRVHDRLDLLTSGRRDAVGRQRTLSAAIGWSWDLLPPAERSALAQCSVFRGGFVLEAADAVLNVGSALDLLEALRNKSLVHITRTDDGVRFGVYSTIRDYAASHLDEAARRAAETRHADHFVHAAQTWAGPRLCAERDNLLAVVERGLAHDDTRALRALLALEPVLARRGPFALHLELLGRAIDQPGAPADLRAQLLTARGEALRVSGRPDGALGDLEDAIASAATDRTAGRAWLALGILHSQSGRPEPARLAFERALTTLTDADAANALLALGTHHLEQNRLDQARTHYARARALMEEAGDLAGTAHSLGNLAIVHTHEEQFDDAEDCYARVIDIFRDLGELRREAIALGNLALLLHDRGRLPEAAQRYDRAVALARRCGDARAEGSYTACRGLLHHEQGVLAAALSDIEHGVARLRAVGDRRLLGQALGYLGAVTADLQRFEEAEAILDEARGLLEQIGDDVSCTAVDVRRAHIERGRGRSDVAADLVAGARAAAAASQEVRLALRLAERDAPALPAPGVLLLGPDARWFQPPVGDRVNIAQRDTLRRVVGCLARAHRETPGTVVGVDDLLAAGWPGERVATEAGSNRVRVALATLRKLGLREVLRGRRGGWYLDPSCSVKHVH